MSTQMLMSDLLTDLSTEEQQILAGGQFTSEDESEDEDKGESEGTGRVLGSRRLYRIRSIGRAIVSVQKLR
ncbi:hypothetical protein [Calothrix sp. PCC 7507]|uniref:hypothetical protein n=1 Tax=Calothrix sp. PCC 7507 TaxID=99598 RepID=UPI00029F1B7E|nr:hypothetical protein [Calothrix sp. PCC 7507]AFY32592.1 hypothetical protein Cal7507_2150 [Calothrix sp. PCC 7507]